MMLRADLPPDFVAAEFERLDVTLRTMAMVMAVDAAALRAYCQAYGRWAEAERCRVAGSR